MTNVGIIHPEPGYHDALREITRRTGTLLLIDETHTICTGPGGYTREHGLDPDLFVVGKLVGGGVPAAAYGLSQALAERVLRVGAAVDSDTNGIGGTLAGNALSLAAMRATLTEVLTPEFYARAIPLAERFTAGVESVIAEKGLPWIVKRLGCRAEYWFRATPPRNGGEAAAAVDADLDRYMHLARPQPRDPHDPLPQHGALLPRGHRGRRGPPHRGLSRERRRRGRGLACPANAAWPRPSCPRPPMSELLFSCQELTKAFGAAPLFEGLSFGIFEGDHIGLVGPNGSGKSTLV